MSTEPPSSMCVGLTEKKATVKRRDLSAKPAPVGSTCVKSGGD